MNSIHVRTIYIYILYVVWVGYETRVEGSEQKIEGIFQISWIFIVSHPNGFTTKCFLF